jgi:predicted nucleic acid-binding protein
MSENSSLKSKVSGIVEIGRYQSLDLRVHQQPAATRHADIRAPLLAFPAVRANLVHDADLAALAIEHGLTLCSTDGDFARFPGLRWQNPLAG